MPPDLMVLDPERWAAEAAHRIAAILEEAVEARGAASVALAGGSSPRPVYQELARRTVPWQAVDFFLGDERVVGEDDPRSNLRMVRQALGTEGAVPPGRIHPVLLERVGPEEAAARYAGLLPDPLDLVLLGIGEDGHVASLFPGAPAMRERTRKVVTSRSPVPPHNRITVTPGVIQGARRVVVLAQGKEKAAAVARALEGKRDLMACPGQLARAGLWILDVDAACLLSGAGAGG